MKQAHQEPQKFGEVLAWEINVSPVVLDRALNNAGGEFLLDRISWSIHIPSNQENEQTLRSPLVLSAKNDNKISLIEILQNYLTTEVTLRVNGLSKLMSNSNFGQSVCKKRSMFMYI